MTSVDVAPDDVFPSMICVDDLCVPVYLTVASCGLLHALFLNEVGLTKSIGCTVADAYPGVRWPIGRI